MFSLTLFQTGGVFASMSIVFEGAFAGVGPAPMLGLAAGGLGGDNNFGSFGTGGSGGGTLGAPGTVGGPGPLDAFGPSVTSAGRLD